MGAKHEPEICLETQPILTKYHRTKPEKSRKESKAERSSDYREETIGKAEPSRTFATLINRFSSLKKSQRKKPKLKNLKPELS